MGLKDRKLAVLDRLGREHEATSLQDLVEKLGPDFPARSVRRWLRELVREGIVEKLGARRWTKYQLLQQGGAPTDCLSEESRNVIEAIRRPIYERPPIAYADHWVEAYKPNKSFYIPKKLRLQLRIAGMRVRREDPAGTYAHQIFNRLLIDLSYNSSRLEGNTYSLLDTQKLILEGASAKGKLDEEKLMILNHKEAIRYLVDNASKLKVDTHTIYTLHYLLADGLIDAQYVGKVRNYGVRVGGSSYIPFEDPKQLQVRLDQIVHKGSLIEDPYEQSLFLLIHISYLQAFVDVNKRTARLSANIPLIQGNFVPLSFNDIDKNDYMNAMIAIYELQDIRPILDLYAFSYLRTCAMYDTTVKTIGFDEVRARYRTRRRTVIREIILQHVAGKKLKKTIESQALKWVSKEDREAFIGDVLEDLQYIDENRLAGLGVTVEQLNAWRTLQSHKH